MTYTKTLLGEPTLLKQDVMLNQESHLSAKSRVVAAIAGAALAPAVYIVTLPLFPILLGT